MEDGANPLKNLFLSYDGIISKKQEDDISWLLPTLQKLVSVIACWDNTDRGLHTLSSIQKAPQPVVPFQYRALPDGGIEEPLIDALVS
ncbi:hypothetical protein [Gluconobacter kondonii]|uniref:hypothetical protein n=1 Tax=Gluconobacter kondonii TaxID=941463 RepID=UPI001B8B7390|nr:hypothetical protein [Gluconobacter kondonii]MBS1053809.1 hypothetical protein [Gluconobacter kondonii]